MLKVMTIVGTRPELIRLSKTIELLDRYCAHTLVHTGQNYDYELNGIFFADLGIRAPDHFLEVAGASAAETMGNVIIAADRVMGEVMPDALLILGDTNSCLAAIPAKRRRIPIFHMEAGNRCFDQRVPEEINRRIVDSISDINMPYSQIARQYLLREGFPPDQIVVTGSPMGEIIAAQWDKIGRSTIVADLGLQLGKFFVVSAHREENIDSEKLFPQLVGLLERLVAEFGLPVIFSAHPRTRKKLEAKGVVLPELVRTMKPLGFSDYVALQLAARATLSDSGTISEESAILNFPALNIREAHERPEAMEEGAVMMTGLDIDRILDGIAILADQPRGADRRLGLPADYSPVNVSDKVLRIIQSYTGFVKRVVWRQGY